MTQTDPDEPETGEDEAAADEAAGVDVFTLPPGADPALDWGLTAHLHPDGSPRIIERHLVVPPELAGLRLDHFVKTQIPRLSRTRIQGIITDQLRRADGHAPKPATIVAAGDHYVLRRPARPEPPCPRDFGVLVTDPRLYVVDKPAGLPVHASAKFYFNTLTRVLGERFPDEPELQICHRLDRETSGCLVVARDRAAAAAIKGAFATKDRVRKQYLAIVHGAHEIARRFLSASEAANELGDVVYAESFQREPFEELITAEVRNRLGQWLVVGHLHLTVRPDCEQAWILRGADEVPQEKKTRLIRPVDVLQQEDNGRRS